MKLSYLYGYLRSLLPSSQRVEGREKGAAGKHRLRLKRRISAVNMYLIMSVLILMVDHRKFRSLLYSTGKT